MAAIIQHEKCLVLLAKQNSYAVQNAAGYFFRHFFFEVTFFNHQGRVLPSGADGALSKVIFNPKLLVRAFGNSLFKATKIDRITIVQKK